MSETKESPGTARYQRAEYVGRLVRADIPGTLRYLDACGESERADALRQRLHNPPAYATGYPALDPILDAYQDYFRRCFSAGLEAPPDAPFNLKAVEREARKALERDLQNVLDMPGADLDNLEDTAREKAQALGLHFLGGDTQGFLGPYVWQETTRTDYEVELPLGVETLTVFWMDGFLMRSWLDWLSGGETGAGGWAKQDGIYCVRKAYEGDLDKPAFTISFLKHEAQHHADFRREKLSASDLEYRAKLVEMIYYPDATFLRSLLISGDLSNQDNSHAYAAGKITAGLAAWLDTQGVVGGAALLEKAAQDEDAWEEHREMIRKGARVLFDAHTEMVESAI